MIGVRSRSALFSYAGIVTNYGEATSVHVTTPFTLGNFLNLIVEAGGEYVLQMT